MYRYTLCMCSTCMCLMYLKLLLIAPLQRVKNWLEDVTRWWLLIKLWFRLPSASAKGAVMTAQKLLEWSSQPESNCVFEPFSCELVEGLDDCLRVNRRNLQSRQEFMWKNLFKFHSSPEFWSKWSDFLLSSILVFSPLQFFFYQFVVDQQSSEAMSPNRHVRRQGYWGIT